MRRSTILSLLIIPLLTVSATLQFPFQGDSNPKSEILMTFTGYVFTTAEVEIGLLRIFREGGQEIADQVMTAGPFSLSGLASDDGDFAYVITIISHPAIQPSPFVAWCTSRPCQVDSARLRYPSWPPGAYAGNYFWQPTACNLPPPQVWPPDGCPDYSAIAPPATPIPPACVVDARVERWDEDGTPVIELSIYVDHPEIGSGITTYTKLARYRAANPQSETCPECEAYRGVRNPKSEWELVDLDWEVDCGKDEGPLTWASLQVLNGNASAVLSIYQRPLPAWYIALLMGLRGQPHLYLPVILR
ncbi:MAG TPA: hypothetical protein EYH32_04705 [Anaerolineae bacterium]|nr:hypothetical protein [Anaerolineae bacterium]